MGFGKRKQYLTYNATIKSARLPSAYQEVEYIQSSGAQYIDTGYKAGGNSAIYLDLAYTSNTSDGTYNNTGYDHQGNAGTMKFCLGYQHTDQFLFFGINTTNYNATNWIVGLNVRIQQFIDAKNGIYGYTKDGTTYSSTVSTFSNTSAYNFILFQKSFNGSINSDLTATRCKMYACQIYDNGTLVRNLVPCYRKIDNEVGMYDLVNGVFYTNQGSGEFTCGVPIIYDSRYQQVEYIQNANDSGVTYTLINNFPYKIHAEFERKLNNVSEGTLMRTYPAVSSERLTYIGFNSSAELRINFANYQNFTSSLISNNVRFNYLLSLNSSNITATINGVSYTKSYNGILSNQQGLQQFESTSFVLFSNNIGTDNYGCWWAIYWLKCFDKNNNLSCSLVPCYRKSDNEIGLLDIVNDVFYTNQGTGTFAKGGNL